jgi:hypothetical protein
MIIVVLLPSSKKLHSILLFAGQLSRKVREWYLSLSPYKL